MIVIAIMAGFAFGYCVVDLFRNYQAEKRIEQFIKDLDNK